MCAASQRPLDELRIGPAPRTVARLKISFAESRSSPAAARSVLAQQRAEPLDLVVDAVRAQGVPIGAGVDCQHGLLQPTLRFGSDAGKREVGADLHDELDARIVDLAYRAPQAFGRLV